MMWCGGVSGRARMTIVVVAVWEKGRGDDERLRRGDNVAVVRAMWMQL